MICNIDYHNDFFYAILISSFQFSQSFPLNVLIISIYVTHLCTIIIEKVFLLCLFWLTLSFLIATFESKLLSKWGTHRIAYLYWSINFLLVDEISLIKAWETDVLCVHDVMCLFFFTFGVWLGTRNRVSVYWWTNVNLDNTCI